MYRYTNSVRHKLINNNSMKYIVVVKRIHIRVQALRFKSRLWALRPTSNMTKDKLFNFSSIFFLISKKE